MNTLSKTRDLVLAAVIASHYRNHGICAILRVYSAWIHECDHRSYPCDYRSPLFWDRNTGHSWG